ncbi:MAG: hypothetical protein AAF842_09560 [Planctomycetota bacterium]
MATLPLHDQDTEAIAAAQREAIGRQGPVRIATAAGEMIVYPSGQTRLLPGAVNGRRVLDASVPAPGGSR